MLIKYECDICSQLFHTKHMCKRHELDHFKDLRKTESELNRVGRGVCEFCDHCYYVYGCEAECNFKDCSYANAFKDFKLKENK